MRSLSGIGAYWDRFPPPLPCPVIAASFFPAFAWLGAFALALALHLWLHPARVFFRGGLAALGRLPLMPGLFFLTHSLVLAMRPVGIGDGVRIDDWPMVLGACLRDGLRDLAWLTHDAAWLRELRAPLGLVVLQALAAAALQVWWFLVLPAGPRRRSTSTSELPASDILGPRLRPLAPVENPAEPEVTLDRSILPHWRGVLLLAGVHAVLISARRLGGAGGGMALDFLELEFLLALMPLAFAAAHSRGGFAATGEAMLRVWRVIWLPWLGWAATACALLALLSFTGRVVAAQAGLPDAVRWLSQGLLSAMIHAWLLASCILLLRRSSHVVPLPVASPTP